MAAARHGRHAAPSRGRHAARRSDRRPGQGGRSQPVAALLLTVTTGALGLVALLPSAGTAGDDGAARTVAAAPAGVPADRTKALSRASRSRALPSVPPSAAPSPTPTPTPTTAPTPAPSPVDVLPGCTVGPAAATRYANGQIPSRALCALPGHDGHRLRADAARAFVRLEQAHRAAFGEPLCVTDSYRSLAAQRALARQKPGLAGRPGISVHGEGLALDLACGAEGFGTRTHRWLVANAGEHGWYQPTWARRGGSKPEPWHWELRGS